MNIRRWLNRRVTERPRHALGQQGWVSARLGFASLLRAYRELQTSDPNHYILSAKHGDAERWQKGSTRTPSNG